MPYTNLRSEMDKRGVTVTEISRGLGMRRATVSDKINGKFKFYYDEVKEIRERYFPDCEIEYLFSIEGEGIEA